MSHPTVKDLLKLPGAKVQRQPEAVILSFEECMLLHRIIMAHRQGGLEVHALDRRLVTLGDAGFIKQDPVSRRFKVTQEGVRHMRPDLFRKKH